MCVFYRDANWDEYALHVLSTYLSIIYVYTRVMYICDSIVAHQGADAL